VSASASEDPPAPPSVPQAPAAGATYALAVLALVNFLNFLDRFVVTAVLPKIQKDLSLSDTESGALGTAFIVVFMLAAPIFGRLGDTWNRTRLMAAGVAVWSAATAAAGLARSYGALLATRAVVGIGEASYATLSPTLIADLYPVHMRARAMSIFFAAMPVGAAAGFLLGGFVGERWGWRMVFYVAGLPGLLLALLNLTVREPVRGRFEAPAAKVSLELRAVIPSLARNGKYVLLVLGYTAYVFAVGGLAFWMPTFLHRTRGMDLVTSNTWFGAVTVVGGLVGSLLGGWVADRLLTRTKHAHAIVAGTATLLAAPCLLAALVLPDPRALFAALLAAEVLIFASQAPVNTAIVGAVATEIRATAISGSVLVQHLLGDAISPTVIGWTSDLVRGAAERSGAAPAEAAKRGLEAGVLVVPAFLLIGGLLWGLPAFVRREEKDA